MPEAVAFAFVAGVDPLVGLYAAFFVGLITVRDRWAPGHDLRCHRCDGGGDDLGGDLFGIEYLFAAVVIAGIFQILAGVFKLGASSASCRTR